MRAASVRPGGKRRRRARGRRGPGPAAILCILALGILALGLGCGAVETREELQAFAAESPAAEPREVASPPPAAAAPAGEEDLDGFPLVGSVFPGLGGRLHSSLCDPASDPYGTCL